MFELNGYFRLVGQNRKTKARYAVGLKVGDIVKFSMDFIPTNGASRGNYALSINVFKYVDGSISDNLSYERVGSATQNEFFHGFNIATRVLNQWEKEPVFHVQQISYDEIMKLSNKTTDDTVASSVSDGSSPVEEELWNLIDEVEVDEHTQPLIENIAKILNKENIA